MTALRNIYGDNEPRELWFCVGPEGRQHESFGQNRILQCPFTLSGLHGEECGIYHMTRLADRFQPERTDAMNTEEQLTKLTNVHPVSACEGQFCVVHNPSSHHMRDWPLHWRDDRRFFERICPHGVGHPDPDQISYWQRKWGRAYADVQAVHGCEGCCEKGAGDESV